MLVTNMLLEVLAYVMPDLIPGFRVCVSILKKSKVNSSFTRSPEVMDLHSKLKIVDGRN